MKLLSIILLVFISLSCSMGLKKTTYNESDSFGKHKYDSSLTNQSFNVNNEDTIIYYSKFLVSCSKKMKIDFIPTSEKKTDLLIAGDTLFHDDSIAIIGDKSYYAKIYQLYNSPYEFSQFAVDSYYQGQLAIPNLAVVENNDYWTSILKCNYLSVNEWKEYITSQCEKEGINFAGHFTIVVWGCGCQCQLMIIVERVTGKVYFPDMPDDRIDGFYGAQYRKDSRMIITNYGLLEDHKGYCLKSLNAYPEIYEWNDSIVKRIE